jgi:hydrogenase maturation factor
MIHCVTCSDEALEAEVLGLGADSDMALVRIGQEQLEVDISVVDAVVPGDRLLVHGGVAIAKL